MLFAFYCINITISKFYRNGSVHIFLFEKTLTFKISLKQMFTPSSVIKYL